MADEPYVTTRVAAKAIGAGTSTLQRWAAKGLVRPAWRTPGGQARWLVSELRAQLEMPGAPPRGDTADKPGEPE